MATQVDRLQTIIMATGHSAYRAAMRSSSASVKELGLSELGTSVASVQLAGGQKLAAGSAGEMAAAESAATTATVGLEAVVSPLTITIAALTAGVLLAAAAFAALAAATLAAAGGAAAGLIDVTKAARDAEDALRKAASVAGLTEEEISDLRDSLPLDELAALGFGATSAGEGLWFLYSAGLSTEEALDTLGPAALLAAALNADLDAATGLLVSTMKALGIETDKSAAVVDGFAAVNAVTMASFDKLQNAMIYAASAGRQFGWGFYDILNVLGQFYNVGLRGTQAGTAFRMGLIQLAQGGDKARDAMKRLGLEWEVAASLLSKPRELIEYLSQAQWDAASATEVFGARALVWTQILQGGVEVWDELDSQIRETGKAQEQADIAMNSLAGSIDKLAAEWENLRVSIGGLTQYLAKDVVDAATLAGRALKAGIDEYKKSLEDADTAADDSKDAVLDMAVAILKGIGLAAEALLSFIEILETVRAHFYLVAAAANLLWSPRKALEYGKTAIAILEEAGQRTVRWHAVITKVMKAAFASIKALRGEMLKDVPAPEAEELAAIAVPPVLPPSDEVDAVAVALERANLYIEKLRSGEEQLEIGYRRARALTDDRLSQLLLEIEYRQQAAVFAEAIAKATGIAAAFEEDEVKAARAVGDALRETERAQVAILEAEQAYRKEIIRMQERAWKEADRERLKAARDYDRLIKKGDSVRDAIQAVIGGTLGRGIQEAIGRVSGAGLRQGIGAGAVRAVGTNEIRVVVDIAGLNEEGKRAITNHLTDVLTEGVQQLPALSY